MNVQAKYSPWEKNLEKNYYYFYLKFAAMLPRTKTANTMGKLNAYRKMVLGKRHWVML